VHLGDAREEIVCKRQEGFEDARAVLRGHGLTAG
jgi:hypothetical protein